MLEQLRRAYYLAALKWKQGEGRAVATANRGDREGLVVLFDIPPAGDYDHELGRVPTPTEHIKLFGPRLFKHCGSAPVFIDATRIDEEQYAEGFSGHPLTELLARGRLAGARPCPVTGFDRSAGYQQAVRNFCRLHSELPIGLRLRPSDLEGPVADRVAALLRDLDCLPGRVFVVIDFGAPSIDEDNLLEFAELVVDRINDLPNLYEWLNLAVLATSFPEKIGLKAGESKRVKRLEWIVYRSMINMSDRLLRRPVFADYALEFPGRYVTGKAQPVAQLRYTSDEEVLLLKGLTTKKPNGYGAIREVATRLVGEKEFMGHEFSSGDEFFLKLHRNLDGPGNASTWRWAWTDHHLTTVLLGLRELLGIPTKEVVKQPPTEQMALDV